MEDNGSIRDRLIRAGLEDLQEYGISGLSMRRAAEKCGVSCAAPYKHFASKNEMLRAMYDYVKQAWYQQQTKIIEKYADNAQEAMAELCFQYIEFLTSDPVYLTLILSQDKSTAETFLEPRTSLTPITRAVYDRYCDEQNVDELTKLRRMHAIRCIMYGAAVLFRNGDVPKTDEYLAIMKFNIVRILTK